MRDFAIVSHLTHSSDQRDFAVGTHLAQKTRVWRHASPHAPDFSQSLVQCAWFRSHDVGDACCGAAAHTLLAVNQDTGIGFWGSMRRLAQAGIDESKSRSEVLE